MRLVLLLIGLRSCFNFLASILVGGVLSRWATARKKSKQGSSAALMVASCFLWISVHPGLMKRAEAMRYALKIVQRYIQQQMRETQVPSSAIHVSAGYHWQLLFTDKMPRGSWKLRLF